MNPNDKFGYGQKVSWAKYNYRYLCSSLVGNNMSILQDMKSGLVFKVRNEDIHAPVA